MNRLIVLVDFSPYTPTLLRLASSWKETFNLDLVFIHKMDGLAPTLSNRKGSDKFIEFNKKEAQKTFLKYFEESGLSLNSDEFQFEAISSQLSHFLDGFLGPEDVLLLGLKGTGLLKKLLIGSTASTLINQLNQTIIAIPQEIEHAIPRKLILPCQEKHPINQEALESVLMTIGEEIQEIELLTIVNGQTELEQGKKYLEKVKANLDNRYDCKISLYESTNAFEAIKSRFNQNPEYFILLQKGSRHLKDKLFRSFFINELVHDGKTPLIILPVPDGE
jgi:nucleotide-binding universal stress UspA family protein